MLYIIMELRYMRFAPCGRLPMDRMNWMQMIRMQE